jgi:hypothetical protein
MPTRIAHDVAVLNRSSVLSDSELHAIVSAAQKDVTHNFSGAWGIDARMHFVGKKNTTDWSGKFNIVVLDDSDVANALGYHDLTPEGLPLSKVFAGTDQKYGAKVSVTFSHELDEMLLDPYISLCAYDDARGIFVAYEASDAVEADELAHDIDGIPFSNFVLPHFFDPTAKNRQGVAYDFGGVLKAPFELASGGYEAVFVPGRGWSQNTKREGGQLASDRPKVGSRRERRIFGQGCWQRSDD